MMAEIQHDKDNPRACSLWPKMLVQVELVRTIRVARASYFVGGGLRSIWKGVLRICTQYIKEVASKKIG